MRVLGVLIALVFGASQAFGQSAPEYPVQAPAAVAKPKPKPKTPPKPKAEAAPAAADAMPVVTTGSAPAAGPAAAPAPAKPGLRDAYTAIPLAERAAIQSDLIWTGDYNGVTSGEFSDRLVAAVKTFQKRIGAKETGVLNPQERTTLAATVKPLQDEAGWRMVDDPVTGIRLGVPAKFAAQTGAGQSGTRWFSQQGQIHIETFANKNTTLEAIYELQRAPQAGRKVRYQVIRPDFFVVSGMQGLKKFYVRASARGGEVRGLAIYYDQAMEGEMEPVVMAMSSAFMPFDAAGIVQAPNAPRRNVEYATGLMVSGGGHIVTERHATDACRSIVVPGFGNAERIAEDTGSGLALLRVYGARHPAPIALQGTPAPSGTIALVGIADPQTQGGNANVTRVAARTNAANPRALEQAPTPGFAGAAALDEHGRLIGVVALKPAVVAGPAAGAQAELVSVESVMYFLRINNVAPATGRASAEDAKAAAVRVICVRK